MRTLFFVVVWIAPKVAVCHVEAKSKAEKTHRSGLIAPAKGCSHGVAAAGWGVKAGRRTTRADIVDKVGVVDLRTERASVTIRHAHPLGHSGR